MYTTNLVLYMNTCTHDNLPDVRAKMSFNICKIQKHRRQITYNWMSKKFTKVVDVLPQQG